MGRPTREPCPKLEPPWVGFALSGRRYAKEPGYLATWLGVEVRDLRGPFVTIEFLLALCLEDVVFRAGYEKTP